MSQIRTVTLVVDTELHSLTTTSPWYNTSPGRGQETENNSGHSKHCPLTDSNCELRKLLNNQFGDHKPQQIKILHSFDINIFHIILYLYSQAYTHYTICYIPILCHETAVYFYRMIFYFCQFSCHLNSPQGSPHTSLPPGGSCSRFPW